MQHQNSQIKNLELLNKSQLPLYFTHQSQSPLSLTQYLKNAENVHVKCNDLTAIDQHQQQNVKTKLNTTSNKNESVTHLNNIFHIFDISNTNQLNLLNNLQLTSHQNDDKKFNKNNITNSNEASRCQKLRYNKNDTSLLAKQINLNSLANMMMLRQQQQQQQQQQQKNMQINENIVKKSN